MYSCVHVKHRLLLADCNGTGILSTDSRGDFNIKFHENPSIGSRVVLCVEREGERETDERTDMTKVIITLSTSTNAPDVQSVNVV